MAETIVRPYLTQAALRAWFELRHARIRLAIAENELAWAQDALRGGMSPETALGIMADAFAELWDSEFLGEDLWGRK